MKFLVFTLFSSLSLLGINIFAAEKVVNYLNYEPFANGVPQPTIRLDYEVNDDQIRLGNSVFSEDTFRIYFGTPESIDPLLKNVEGIPKSDIIVLSAPNWFFANNTTKGVEIISDGGNVIWNYSYTSDDFELGERIYQTTKKSKLFMVSEKIVVLANKTSGIDLASLAKNKNQKFRICLKQEEEKFYTKLCSPYYKIKQSFSELKKQEYKGHKKIIFEDKELPLKGILPVTTDQNLKVFLSSSNEYSIEMNIKPKPFYLVDFFQDKETNEVVLVGHTHWPLSDTVKIFDFKTKSIWLKEVGWLPRNDDIRSYWSMHLPKGNRALNFTSFGGGELTYEFQFAKVPHESKRVGIDATTIKGTYVAESKIYGVAPLGTEVKTKDNSAKVINEVNGRFVWNFKAPRSGEEYSNSLLLKDGADNWNASYSIYRGYSNEFSFRLASTVTTALQVNLLAEIAYNHWFEKFLSSESNLWSIQRWGLSFKVFHPMKTFVLKDKNLVAPTLSLSTLDLKYRLTPGLWERDESWGFILGEENIELNKMKASLLGTGFFWARSMPKFFDDLMNYLPFMSYPKWVDLDFIYYPSSLTPHIVPGSNYTLNFHGKILWTKGIFGEAGFGYKSYDIGDKTLDKRNWFRTFYGTVGLGMNF
jgi:hypothetical protein